MRLRPFLITTVAALVMGTLFGGCVTTTPRDGSYVDRYATNPSDPEGFCRTQAQNAYNNAVEHNTRVLLGGAAGGTALGAGVGSVSRSRAGEGALIGLGLGLLGGATQTLSPQREADRAYGLCISRNRKHL